MISWFNAPNEGLSPGGQLTLKTLTATENKTYSEEGTAYTSVTVNVEGGGGGDLTTAKLTFVYNKVCEMTTLLPAILKSGDTYPGSSTTGDHIEGGIEFGSSYNPASLDVPLYKGKLSAYLYPNGVTISVSGDAIWDSGTGVLTVTGDCTITIS